MKTFINTKLVQPIIGFLNTGMSPRKLAIAVALGAVIGIIPIVGITTILCAVLAYLLRVNIAVIQLVNYIVYPLQILLFIPFIKLGIYMFGVNPLPYDIEVIWDRLQSDLLQTIGDIWLANLLGILVWLIIAPIMYLTIFFISKHLINRLNHGK